MKPILDEKVETLREEIAHGDEGITILDNGVSIVRLKEKHPVFYT